MYAVVVGLDDRESYGAPDIYVFNDLDKATDFYDWLIDTDPADDGTDEFRDSFDAVVTQVSIPPQHWDQAL